MAYIIVIVVVFVVVIVVDTLMYIGRNRIKGPSLGSTDLQL